MDALLTPEEFDIRLKKVKLLLLDVDGVLTDGSIFFI
jgi:3-deoxy-D-manno-octulosonate 8-phosphate phosphatase KdsC-like HAD superfamily phosphatase